MSWITFSTRSPPKGAPTWATQHTSSSEENSALQSTPHTPASATPSTRGIITSYPSSSSLTPIRTDAGHSAPRSPSFDEDNESSDYELANMIRAATGCNF